MSFWDIQGTCSSFHTCRGNREHLLSDLLLALTVWYGRSWDKMLRAGVSSRCLYWSVAGVRCWEPRANHFLGKGACGSCGEVTQQGLECT